MSGDKLFKLASAVGVIPGERDHFDCAAFVLAPLMDALERFVQTEREDYDCDVAYERLIVEYHKLTAEGEK